MTDISPQASIQDARTGTAQDAAQDMQAEAAGMAAAPDPNMDATGNAPTNATAPADVAESGDHDSGSFVLDGENQDTSVPEEGTKEAEKTEKSDKTDKAKKSGKTGKTRKSGASGKSARKKAATRRRATTGSESEKGMTEAEPPKEWTTPVPFATRTLPELDCAKLPPVLGDFCRGISRELQVPEETVLASALAVIATCAQSTYSVELYGTSAVQPTNLFIMSPMQQVRRKRATLKACLAPVRVWEEAQAREVGPEITKENIQKMIAKRAIRKLSREAVDAQVARKEEVLQELVRQICALQTSLYEGAVVPRLVTDTLAGLEDAMHEQHDTFTLASASDNCLDIFSAASSRSAKSLVAKAWDADRHDVNRKDRAYSMWPRLSMALAPQPDALADPKKVKILQSRGLATRFIYFMPIERTFGEETRAPKEVVEAFFRRVLRILPASWNKPEEARTLTLSRNADLLWRDYQKRADRLCQGLAAPMQEWTTIFASDVVGRIAALFHLVSCDNPRTNLVISAEEMAQALALGDLLFEHAKAAFALMLQDNPEDSARKVLDAVSSSGWSVFSARECFQSLKGQGCFRTMKPLNTALEALIEHGYIRTISVPGKSGRPMVRYELNPAVVQTQSNSGTAAVDAGATAQGCESVPVETAGTVSGLPASDSRTGEETEREEANASAQDARDVAQDSAGAREGSVADSGEESLDASPEGTAASSDNAVPFQPKAQSLPGLTSQKAQ